MLIHPTIDPVIFAIGPLAVRWYGMMYLVGFAVGWWLGRARIRAGQAPITQEQFDDLLFSVEQIIHYLSTGVGLRAGDVICTGTPGTALAISAASTAYSASTRRP